MQNYGPPVISFPPDLILFSNKTGAVEVNPKHLNGFLAISLSYLEEEENINVRLKCL